MKKIIIIITILLACEGLFACTLFWANRNDRILCAKNMDWSNPATRMLFLPASERVYGRMYFGIEGSWGFTNTSGMNDQGLWYAGASLAPRTDIVNTYNKPESDYELVEKVMRECATVDEAIQVFTQYWEPHWNGHTLLADKFGNCVAIEYGNDDVVFIRNTQDFQVMTNFYLCDTSNARWYDCYRYQVAEAMLSDSAEVSFNLFRDIADATHADGTGQTSLTTLHDLKSGDIQLYSMRNFHEVLTINLFDELAKGNHYLACPDYFSKIKLIAPSDGEEVSSGDVRIVWTSETEDYILRYSAYADFRDYEEIIYEAPAEVQQASTNWSVIVIPFFSVVFVILKRKHVILIFIVFMSIFNTACYQVEIEPQFSKREHAIVLTNMEAGTTWYWKIMSVNEDYPSESIIYQYKVVDHEE